MCFCTTGHCKIIKLLCSERLLIHQPKATRLPVQHISTRVNNRAVLRHRCRCTIRIFIYAPSNVCWWRSMNQKSQCDIIQYLKSTCKHRTISKSSHMTTSTHTVHSYSWTHLQTCLPHSHRTISTHTIQMQQLWDHQETPSRSSQTNRMHGDQLQSQERQPIHVLHWSQADRKQSRLPNYDYSTTMHITLSMGPISSCSFC